MVVPLIEFKDVTKRFDSRTILDRVNLQIYEGQVTTIIGLSGSGKSVVLKHIVGLLKPDEGAILFRGKPIHQMGKKEINVCLAILSMIAHYHKKFGFTAILVSHEIPDVFFISNRILALYDRTIVFQGTPEELEAFEHPFKDEVLKSIEGLQEELTGLYSRRYFKVRYQTELKREAFREAYAVVVFTIENLDAISAGLGHEAAPEAIRCMGAHIDKHFGAVGGFSTRQNTNEFVTVLPNSNLVEVEGILESLTQDFQEQGIRQVQAGNNKGTASRENFEFTIRAGLAQGHQGQSTVELESIIALAKQNQKEIARLRCDAWGQAN